MRNNLQHQNCVWNFLRGHNPIQRLRESKNNLLTYGKPQTETLKSLIDTVNSMMRWGSRQNLRVRKITAMKEPFPNIAAKPSIQNKIIIWKKKLKFSIHLSNWVSFVYPINYSLLNWNNLYPDFVLSCNFIS